MSTIYICNRCGETINNIYTRFTVDCLRGHMERDYHILDLCEKCNEEFEKFMNSTKDESSNVKLRPWSEVGPPPKINGYPLSANDDILSKARYKIGSYIRSDYGKGDIYKIMDIRLRDDGEIVYTVRDLSNNTYFTLSEKSINNWCTLIVKYSCDGCKLEGTDDCMCDTCIVGDPKGPRRQWWKPKEDE